MRNPALYSFQIGKKLCRLRLSSQDFCCYVWRYTLVTGAVNVAKRLNMPAIVIGIVLVGFGTSVLVFDIHSNMQADTDRCRNVIGSNIANILLVAGAGAFGAIVADKGDLQRDGLVLVRPV